MIIVVTTGLYSRYTEVKNQNFESLFTQNCGGYTHLKGIIYIINNIKNTQLFIRLGPSTCMCLTNSIIGSMTLRIIVHHRLSHAMLMKYTHQHCPIRMLGWLRPAILYNDNIFYFHTLSLAIEILIYNVI